MSTLPANRLLVILLLLSGWMARGVVYAQTVHTIVEGQSVPVMDGGDARGTLSYNVFIVGGEKVESSTYEFEDVGNAVLRIRVTLSAKNGRWADRMRVAFGAQSFRYNRSLWRRDGSKSIVISSTDGHRNIDLRAGQAGTSEYTLPFSFLNERRDDLEDQSSWSISSTANRIQLPALTIRQKKVDAAPGRDPLVGNPTAMVGFYNDRSQPESERARVLNMLETHVRQDFNRRVISDSSIPTTEAFVATYTPLENRGVEIIDNRIMLARNNIARLKPAPEPEEDPDKPIIIEAQRLHNQLIGLYGGRDTAALANFLRRNGDRLRSDDLAAAGDSLICWPEATYELVGERSNRKQIQLRHFARPAYYDIYLDRVTIDDERLRDDHLIDIAIHQPGKLQLAVSDKVCPNKQLLIPLDNLMQANLMADTLAGSYQFAFKGGRRPYSLRLYADSTTGAGWKREGINATTLTLDRDSLQAAGLVGNFRAEAYSFGSDSPVAVSGGTIYIPEAPTPAWVLPLLIVLAIGGLTLLILYILRRAKRGRGDIFSEA